MSARTTHTYKQAVTSVEVDNAIDLRNVNNRIAEKHDVHFGHLAPLVVICIKFFVQEISKSAKVLNFVIDFDLSFA